MRRVVTAAAAWLRLHRAGPGGFAGPCRAHPSPCHRGFSSPGPRRSDTARRLPAEPWLAATQRQAEPCQPSCRTQPGVFLLIIKPNCNRGGDQRAAAPSRWPALPQAMGKRARRKEGEEENRSAGPGQRTGGSRAGGCRLLPLLGVSHILFYLISPFWC